MENVFLTSLTTPEVRQLFRDELNNFFPKTPNEIQIYIPDIKTGNEVCEKLGIGIQTLIKWRQKGKIPFLQLGSSIRYDFNKVIEALEVSKKKGATK